MYSLKQILASESLFNQFFMSYSTSQRLKNIAARDLQKVISTLHTRLGFTCFSTPRLWTPKQPDSPLILIGNPTKSGSLKKPRFGICVAADDEGQDNLYIWTDKSTVSSYADGLQGSLNFSRDWVSWRTKPSPNNFVRYKFPLLKRDALCSDEVITSRTALCDFLEHLSKRITSNDNFISRIEPMLKQQDLRKDVLTPFTIDVFRHSEEEDFDEAYQEAHIEPQDNSVHDTQTITEGLDCGIALHTSHFECADLFMGKETEPRIDELDFLNLSISPNGKYSSLLVGPGIYGLFYEGKLIYAGLYRNGNKGTPFGGNVAKLRWYKHLATVSMRGREVTVAPLTARYLGNLEVQASLNKIGEEGVRNKITAKGGCVAGLRRVLFALNEWEYFRSAKVNDLLAKFSFSYVRVADTALSDKKIRKVVNDAETRTILNLKPICNKETAIGEARSNVDRVEFTSVAENSLITMASREQKKLS